MRILVIGSGGREHAIVWKLAQSKRVSKIFVAPGNPGMNKLAETVNINPSNVIDLAEFAQREKIDFTVTGPELPLSLGIVDEFKKYNLKIFGPTQKASIIETSKSYAKTFMKKHNIPTAEFEIFVNAKKAWDYINSREEFPVVIKTDGLAAGKGVYICKTKEGAQRVIKEIMIDEKFGKAGEQIIIEDFLQGEELSFMVISDGKRAMPLVTSTDYKKIGDGNKGPNTGGMGAVSPSPFINKELTDKIMKKIILPTIENLRLDNREFRGVLYAGLMIDKGEPKVLEFNARFGDPETQVILLRLKSDLLELLEASTDGAIFDINVKWEDCCATSVVLASGGYPGSFETGKPIMGLERAQSTGIQIFHAGTSIKENTFYTNGGRVLNICAKDKNLETTMNKIYDAISFITFENMYFRKDIGVKR